jgi:predicted branched-subunit amino acid permease
MSDRTKLLIEQWEREQDMWAALHKKHENLRRRNNWLLYIGIACLVVWAVGSVIVKIKFGV